MQKRNILNSPRLLELKKRKRKVFVNKIILAFFSFVAIFLGLAYLSKLEQLNISKVEIIGNKVIDTFIVKEFVEKEISRNYLWIFPKTNIFIYPKNSIKNGLSQQLNRIGDISFNIKDKKTLEVSVSERIALYTWCGITMPDNEDKNNKCYFMDKDGFIFDEAPYFSGEVYFKFFGPASFGTYFSKENFKQLISFKDIITTMNLKPVSLSILENGDIKIFLSNLNKNYAGPYILFKVNSDFLKIAENLQTAISTEPLLSDIKNKYSSLIYIDLRFGNKVYYKFR